MTLALPALVTLAAEPLYLLFDLVVVGRYSEQAAQGLAVAGVVLALLTTQLTFLAYGTTARAARYAGAGRREAAVAEGVQATWLAVLIGVVVVAVVQWGAAPVLNLLAGSPELAEAAEQWLRIAVVGAPLILVGMAGSGWLRGVKDTVRPLRYVTAGFLLSAALCPVFVFGLAGAPEWGLAGSAVANVLGQLLTAVLFIAALIREPSTASIAPSWRIMRLQLVLGRDLIVRSAGFQACFLSAVAVAARFGGSAVTAHQLVMHLWNLVALVLDSLAIAAQALIGGGLGARKVADMRVLAWRITRWSFLFALVIALLFAAAVSVVPTVLSTSVAVQEEIAGIWWIFVALIPVAGVVFALDGVLLGSGDAAYLRNITVGSALVGFLPLVWLSLVFGWGLPGIWLGLAAFIALRAVAVVLRARTARWAVAGEDRQVGVVSDEVN